MILDRLKPSERTILGIAMCVLFAVAVEYMIVVPVYRRCSAFNEKIDNTARGLEVGRGYAAKEAPVTAEYQRIVGMLGASGEPAQEIDSIKQAVDEMALEAGLSIISMSHREPESDEQGTYVEFKVEVGKFEAGMPALLGFLDAVGTAPGMLRVANLSITPIARKNELTGTMVITKIMTIGGTTAVKEEEASPESTNG